MLDEESQEIQTVIPWWAQLRTNLVIAFVLLAAVPVILVGYFTLHETRAHAEKQAFNQLESIAEIKQQQIYQWLQSNMSLIEALLADGSAYRRLSAAVQMGGVSENIASTLLNDIYNAQAGEAGTNYLKEIFLYDTTGKIVISSNRARVRQVVARQPYFTQSLNAPYTQPPYYTVGANALSMVMTYPIRDVDGGAVVAVLAVELNLNTLSEIMQHRDGMGETGETYLVSKENGYLLTESRFEGVIENRAHRSEGIDRVLAGTDGGGTYPDYRGQEVVGVYRWIPELNAGFIAEIDKSEAMAAFQRVFNFSALLTILTVAVAVVFGLVSAVRIANPMMALSRAALRIAGGDLSQRITDKRPDEIGLLSRAFNQMADNLQARELERAEAEKAVRESEARLIEAQKIAQLGNYEIDLTNGTIFWSQQSLRLCGLDPETQSPPDLDGFLRSVLHPDDRPAVEQAIQQAIQTTGNGSTLNIEYRVIWPDRTAHYMLTMGQAIQDDTGRVVKIVGTNQDIDAQKRAELERERLQQEVINAQKEALRELSTPVIPIMRGILVMPLIGAIDSTRASDITRSLLEGIATHKAQVVILDITGVQVIDTSVANHLNKAIIAARLKGTHTIVTGMSDAVAETVVDLGIDWRDIETLRNLQSGLSTAIRRLGVAL